MHSREVVDVLTDDDAEVLEAHPVDPLVNGRDELDARNWRPVQDFERLGEHDQGDRTSVPDVLPVRPRMALEQRALVDVQVPIGDADGEVAERVRRDVDAAGNETVALHRREGSIVPDDLGDRIRCSYVAPLIRHRMRCTAELTLNRLSIESIDALDDLGANPWRERRFGVHLDEARSSKHLRRRGIVTGHATIKWSGRFDRKERTEGLRREPLTPPRRSDPVRDL